MAASATDSQPDFRRLSHPVPVTGNRAEFCLGHILLHSVLDVVQSKLLFPQVHSKQESACVSRQTSSVLLGGSGTLYVLRKVLCKVAYRHSSVHSCYQTFWYQPGMRVGRYLFPVQPPEESLPWMHRARTWISMVPGETVAGKPSELVNERLRALILIAGLCIPPAYVFLMNRVMII